ncbi:hypothetical protein E2C01_019500 [Portunus trituberculatus]|uniref:Uncharacterized protein n=1 Tax=Portunus trituberculatus TaxID=210409 RepID=A0A5B7E0L3_PORTR|nr:hypothetical protein [Portunus trituberculatus]
MAEDGPSKSDIEAVFRRLRAVPTNKLAMEGQKHKYCGDCNTQAKEGHKGPLWYSGTMRALGSEPLRGLQVLGLESCLWSECRLGFFIRGGWTLR